MKFFPWNSFTTFVAGDENLRHYDDIIEHYDQNVHNLLPHGTAELKT